VAVVAGGCCDIAANRLGDRAFGVPFSSCRQSGESCASNQLDPGRFRYRLPFELVHGLSGTECSDYSRPRSDLAGGVRDRKVRFGFVFFSCQPRPVCDHRFHWFASDHRTITTAAAIIGVASRFPRCSSQGRNRGRCCARGESHRLCSPYPYNRRTMDF